MRKPSHGLHRNLVNGTRFSQGFTLIELLAAIAILAILAGLTLSTLSGIQTRSESAQCVSNLRQVGLALVAFAGENDGSFPTAGAVVSRGSIDPDTGKPGWTEQIEPYLDGNLKVFRCASGARSFESNKTYGYFLGARAAYLATGTFASVRMQRIDAPSRLILGGDNTFSGFPQGDTDKDDYSTDAPFCGKRPHAGKSNVLFADGSVRAYAAFDSAEMQISYDDPAAQY